MPYEAAKVDDAPYNVYSPGVAALMAKDASVPGVGGYLSRLAMMNRASGERGAYEKQLQQYNDVQERQQAADQLGQTQRAYLGNIAPMAKAGVSSSVPPSQFGIKANDAGLTLADGVALDESVAGAQDKRSQALTRYLDHGIGVPKERLGAAMTAPNEEGPPPVVTDDYMTPKNTNDHISALAKEAASRAAMVSASRPRGGGGGGSADKYTVTVGPDGEPITTVLRTSDPDKAAAVGSAAPASASVPPTMRAMQHAGMSNVTANANGTFTGKTRGGQTVTYDKNNHKVN